MPAPAAVTEVTIHPIVLLSVVDHFNRVAKDTNKRVVGVLLGTSFRGRVDALSSYAVPFEEDSDVWFLDHNYHEELALMFRKVNATEKVVGWYSTGPKIRQNDIEINDLFRKYCPNPAYVIIDVQPKDQEIPTKAYVAVEEVQEEHSNQSRQTFQHISSSVGALEAEEVGVEHLLRDVMDSTISPLSTQINQKLLSLRSLTARLKDMSLYLGKVSDGSLPPNHKLINQIQDIFNLLPNINTEEMARSFAVSTNDSLLVVYLSSLIRSVIALHNLINNQLENRRLEKAATDKEAGDKEKEATLDKDAADKDAKEAQKKDEPKTDKEKAPEKS
jgi:26S proteasome regulatory subunit N8